MIPDDPLTVLLHGADSAANPPRLPADLPDRVRHRQAARIQANRRLKIGVAVSASVVFVMVASFWFRQATVPELAHNPRAEPGANGSVMIGNNVAPVHATIASAEIARLRAQADALGAQADALQRQLNFAWDEQARQDLREQYRRQLAADAVAQTEQSPIDRAALIALGQGDYYRDQQAPQPAQAAYQSVLDNFPTSPWAVVARQRLTQFQMN